MYADFWIVLQWWGSLFLVGAVGWPLTKALFSKTDRSWDNHTLDPRLRGDDKKTGGDDMREGGRAGRSLGEGWWDGGYLFSKAVGMATVAWIVYVLGTLRVMPFSAWSIGLAMGVVFAGGLLANFQFSTFHFKFQISSFKFWVIGLEEVCFFGALLLWSWIKGHEPELRGLEKFMDFGFMQSILNSRFFPPADMWYAGLPINYYSFGHLVTAVLTKLSGLDLAYTFNLMLATIFALTLTMSFSVGYQISHIGQMRQIWQIVGGVLTAFLVTLAGNMQTIYAFTRGYTGENVRPFWELGWRIRDLGNLGGLGILETFGRFWGKIGEGMNTYWYANATRFIPYTIHEFPGYSFVVSDVHGHVLSIPFVLLAIALLVSMFGKSAKPQDTGILRYKDTKAPSQRFFFGISVSEYLSILFYGFLVGILLMTNALDGPIYLTLFVVLLLTAISNIKYQISNIFITLGTVVGVAAVTSLPFLSHFTSFVTGIAVNCPPAFLANTKVGPLIFEGVEKCQISPLWMWWLLWGFFLYCGGILIYNVYNHYKNYNSYNRIQILLIIFFVFALTLVVFPEFFYFKDIYPAHFRSNTMFKLGYQAFILFSIVAGYTITSVMLSFPRKRESRFFLNWILGSSPRMTLFLLLLIPQLFLVSIFPIFAVRSYFGGLKSYEGLEGLGWMRREYPTDFLAIKWLQNQISNFKFQISNSVPPALVEADGDSYTDYGRFSAFTGIPTIIGWPVHEWLWRGTYDVVAPRREEVRQIYESADVEVTRMILVTYRVRYVVVGALEREKYKGLEEWKFAQLGREVFRAGETVIYEMGTQ